ncbi:hypothetical protein [Arthrobacter sp. NPDC093139]|uniref:hypothetical protein n=1 Tax=Arthrobacter sp. NPDC093139 TaxID=3363945 RepID=UPI003818305C
MADGIRAPDAGLSEAALSEGLPPGLAGLHPRSAATATPTAAVTAIRDALTDGLYDVLTPGSLNHAM